MKEERIEKLKEKVLEKEILKDPENFNPKF
jgi:hypothetical protein